MAPSGWKMDKAINMFMPPSYWTAVAEEQDEQASKSAKSTKRRGRSDTPPPRTSPQKAPATPCLTQVGLVPGAAPGTPAFVLPSGVVVAAPATPARLPGARAVGGVRRRRVRCASACFGRWWKWAVGHIVLLVFACSIISCNSRGVFVGINEVGKAVASVSEGAGALAGVSANATVAVANVAIVCHRDG